MTVSAPFRNRYCPTCHRNVEAFRPGPSGRPDATCPRCGALERHRFLTLLLDGLAPLLAVSDVTIDIAPSKQMTPQLKRLAPRGYFSVDFDPAADGRPVDIRASLTQMPLPDSSADFLVCYHVLEHVPDDRAAMREIARVLKPGGIGLVQVPYRPSRVTDEDPSAPVEERLKRFGQADHVRYYGHDFNDRLRESGLDVVRFTPLDVVGQRGVDLMRLAPQEAVWAVRPAAGATGEQIPAGGLVGGSLDSIVGIIARDRVLEAGKGTRAELELELEQARADARRSEKAYRSLRGQPPVRAMAAARNLARGVVRTAKGTAKGAASRRS
jgi:SAM-dependent methyltransferase